MKQIGGSSNIYGRKSLVMPRRGSGKQVASLRCLANNKIMQLEAPYNKEFTESLKASLPSKKRSWDNDDKAWYIPKDQFDRLTHLLEKYFDETILLDFPAIEAASDTWSKLWLIEGAPIEVIKAVYRALSLKEHPDKGGGEERMAEINTAYDELMKEYKNGD